MMDEIVAVWTTVFGDVVPSFLVLQDRVPVRHLFFCLFCVCSMVLTSKSLVLGI